MMAYCSTIVNEDNIFYSFHFCFLLVFSFNSSLFFSWKNLSQSSSPLSLSLSLSHRSPFALSFSPVPLLMTLSLPIPLTSHCPSTHFLITLPSRCGCGFVKFSRWDGMVKDLVVVMVTRSTWLWVCKLDLVMGGEGLLISFSGGVGAEFQWWIMVGLGLRIVVGSMWWVMGCGGTVGLGLSLVVALFGGFA